jgi:hypothetical protein
MTTSNGTEGNDNIAVLGVWLEGIWTIGKILTPHLLKDAGPGWENEGYHDGPRYGLLYTYGVLWMIDCVDWWDMHILMKLAFDMKGRSGSSGFNASYTSDYKRESFIMNLLM